MSRGPAVTAGSGGERSHRENVLAPHGTARWAAADPAVPLATFTTSLSSHTEPVGEPGTGLGPTW